MVDTATASALQVQVEVPVETSLHEEDGDDPDIVSGSASMGEPSAPSVWPGIHARLVELIEQHRSTMIFVNSRRLAERLAGAINETAEKILAAAHHGSVARKTREEIEDQLKRGELQAIVATSSLELGIDMGAVDLVIQIEAPPTISSGIQRIGRASHQVGATSTGLLFPKYQGDLLACAAVTKRMTLGQVETIRYPRNPLDVLAQQIVAVVAGGSIPVEEVFSLVRSAAPFSELTWESFEGVIDLLSGRYPNDDFSDLRPRLFWDRAKGVLTPRKGTQRVAILNAGTIPDRGLYGVYLASEETTGSRRVGELDEEMVFETRAGDVFLLGASSWRVLEIDHDRVIVAPAPGESGKMPFWRGEGPGRDAEFGEAIGSLAKLIRSLPEDDAVERLHEEYGLVPAAASHLVDYVQDQVDATGEVPTHETLLVESFRDEIGDLCVVILSPYGARVHAPWAMAVAADIRSDQNCDVDVMWSDDGFVLRLPEASEPPSMEVLFPRGDEIQDRVIAEVSATALFATHFRENAARALLLPRRSPQKRNPLWLQRRRSADLMKAVAKYESFPILLETYRECLRDVFDIASLKSLLDRVENREIRVHPVESSHPSPFASSLLFNYVSNFIYNGDAPLAERKAQTLTIDHAQLVQLLGSVDLRDLLDKDVIEEVERERQRLDGSRLIRDDEGVLDLLRELGDLDLDEIKLRVDPTLGDSLSSWIQELSDQRRLVEIRVSGVPRYILAEDAGRYRDALGAAIPQGLPQAFLEETTSPMADIVSRYARRRGPLSLDEITTRFGVSKSAVQRALHDLAKKGRVVEGEFRPGGSGREWCHKETLQLIKRRSLAKLRRQIEPVDHETLGRFLIEWHAIDRPRAGMDGILDAVERLQGFPMAASVLETDVLPTRVKGFRSADLDELCAAGEIIWRGHRSLSSKDGFVSLYLADQRPLLDPPHDPIDEGLPTTILELLEQRGALFFEDIQQRMQRFPRDVFDALWKLVWAGRVTNDTLTPLRSLRQDTKEQVRRRGFRSRRKTRLMGTEGRWSLLPEAQFESGTEATTARALQFVERHGVLCREALKAELHPGGFSAIYPVLKVLEENGRLRRGYFVEGLGATQFALPGAEGRLRDARKSEVGTRVLAATDPANAYGVSIPWPETTESTARLQRAVGAKVVLHEGRLLAYVSRSGQRLFTFESEEDATDQDVLDAALHENPLILRRLVTVDGKPIEETRFSDLRTRGPKRPRLVSPPTRKHA